MLHSSRVLASRQPSSPLNLANHRVSPRCCSPKSRIVSHNSGRFLHCSKNRPGPTLSILQIDWKILRFSVRPCVCPFGLHVDMWSCHEEPIWDLRCAVTVVGWWNGSSPRSTTVVHSSLGWVMGTRTLCHDFASFEEKVFFKFLSRWLSKSHKKNQMLQSILRTQTAISGEFTLPVITTTKERRQPTL